MCEQSSWRVFTERPSYFPSTRIRTNLPEVAPLTPVNKQVNEELKLDKMFTTLFEGKFKKFLGVNNRPFGRGLCPF